MSSSRLVHTLFSAALLVASAAMVGIVGTVVQAEATYQQTLGQVDAPDTVRLWNATTQQYEEMDTTSGVAGIRAGTHGFGESKRVAFIKPRGEVVSYPAQQVQEALDMGYELASLRDVGLWQATKTFDAQRWGPVDATWSSKGWLLVSLGSLPVVALYLGRRRVARRAAA